MYLTTQHKNLHIKLYINYKNWYKNWLCGFLMLLGKDTIFKNEAGAILEGPYLAWEKGFR